MEVFHDNPNEGQRELLSVAVLGRDEHDSRYGLLTDAQLTGDDSSPLRPLSPIENSKFVNELSDYDKKDTLHLPHVKLTVSPLAAAAMTGESVQIYLWAHFCVVLLVC